MAISVGTHDIRDLLAVQNQTAIDYGLERIQAILAAELAAHNAVTNDMLGDLAVRTTERAGTSGGNSAGDMLEVDEYGQAPTQKGGTVSTVAWPLRKFQYNVGWTNDFFLVATPADLARMTLNAEIAHTRRLQQSIKAALFGPTNYTFVDRFIDRASLTVKRLVNGDSDQIAVGPNGETFDGATHSHYNANATLTTAALEALVLDVVEHGHGDDLRIYINRADEAAVRLLTGFVAYLDPRITPATTANTANVALNTGRADNRAIGVFAGAEVWVKTWVPANYALCFAAGEGAKPLAFRQRPQAALQGLRIAARLQSHPLYADEMEAYFGFGTANRTVAAVLYFAGGSYVDAGFAA